MADHANSLIRGSVYILERSVVMFNFKDKILRTILISVLLTLK